MIIEESHCPICGSAKIKQLEENYNAHDTAIRMECEHCGGRFTKVLRWCFSHFVIGEPRIVYNGDVVAQQEGESRCGRL